MKTNNVVTAPIIKDVNGLFADWKQINPGTSLNDFYIFLTTPTLARDQFLAAEVKNVELVGAVAAVVYTK